MDTSVEVNAYQTRSWHDTFAPPYGVTLCLKGQHRQNMTDELYGILMRVREHAETDNDVARLNATWPMGSGGTYPDHVHLRATNKDVNAYNGQRLAELPGESVRFHSKDTVLVHHPARRDYARRKMQSVASDVVDLKVGAHVVLTRSVGAAKGGARGRVEVIRPGVSASCGFEGVVGVVG